MERRFLYAREAVAQMTQKGTFVFSPIVYSHELAKCRDFPRDFEFWQSFNRSWIAWCTEVSSLMIEGWRHSVGGQAEREHAKAIRKQLNYSMFAENGELIF